MDGLTMINNTYHDDDYNSDDDYANNHDEDNNDLNIN